MPAQHAQKCPQCQGNQIRAYGLGSERVEQEVQALFPAARVLRWDWETTREKDAHELILTHFANHNADVLVGTQMLAKGLDLPLVTLVGIVLADVGLNLPDPFAAERTFQVLTQVAGRAGAPRGGAGGDADLPAGALRHPGRGRARLRRVLRAGDCIPTPAGLSALWASVAAGVPSPGQCRGRESGCGAGRAVDSRY